MNKNVKYWGILIKWYLKRATMQGQQGQDERQRLGKDLPGGGFEKPQISHY